MAALTVATAPDISRHSFVADSSDELEGCSPRSTEEFYVGQARLQRPHRKVLRWVIRRINSLGKLGKQDSSLVLGGSDGSISDDQQQCLLRLPSAMIGQASQEQCQHAQQHLQQAGQQEPPAVADQSLGTEAVPAWRRLLTAMLRPVLRVLRPLLTMDPGNNDHTVAERLTNVLTSVPFLAVGLHGLRERRCPKGRQFCVSFMGVGLVAGLYHGVGVRNPLRPVMRRLDYWSICYASHVLRRAAHIPLPGLVHAGCAVLAMCKPTAVTALNLGLVEVKYIQSALGHAHLRPSLGLHLVTAAAGLTCFGLEDVATGCGWPPILHSLWHCLSALAVGCTNCLLHHLEMVLLVEGVQVQGM